MEELFKNAVYEHSEETIYVDRLVENVEQQFKGFSLEQRERKKERDEMNEKIKKLTSALSKLKNVKNPRLRKINEERSKKRLKIKAEIEVCKLRLREIDEEENVPSRDNPLNQLREKESPDKIIDQRIQNSNMTGWV